MPVLESQVFYRTLKGTTGETRIGNKHIGGAFGPSSPVEEVEDVGEE